VMVGKAAIKAASHSVCLSLCFNVSPRPPRYYIFFGGCEYREKVGSDEEGAVVAPSAPALSLPPRSQTDDSLPVE